MRSILVILAAVLAPAAQAQAVSCTTVTRAAKTTCTATGGTHYTAWQFLGADGSVVSRGTVDSPTWAGMAVISGGVQVVVTSTTGKQTTVQGILTVNPRTNFAAKNSAASLEANGYTCKNSTGQPQSTITVPSPPTVQNQTFGMFCNIDEWQDVTGQVTDSGPNKGYFFVQSANVLPQFHWTYTPDLMNSSSAFYAAQCGNFNAAANTGFIGGSQLKANTIGHESGMVNGHYGEWVAAYQQALTNPGTELEAYAQLSGTAQNFNGYVSQEMMAVTGTISSDTTHEPCQGLVTNDPTQSCKNDGPVNYQNGGVYAACQ